jgi:methylated-DNA-[protein]-cysteine S-methyltransferase
MAAPPTWGKRGMSSLEAKVVGPPGLAPAGRVWSTTLDSPLGPVQIGACAAGLTRVHFGASAWNGASPEGDPSDAPPEVRALLDAAVHELGAYFKGRLRAFTVPLAPVGTEFQRAVWAELRKIPFGERRTYRDIAVALGRPTATRAVGAANGQNPLGILQPCHRVLGADGSLTGFAGGLAAKKWLLEHEHRHAPLTLA